MSAGEHVGTPLWTGRGKLHLYELVGVTVDVYAMVGEGTVGEKSVGEVSFGENTWCHKNLNQALMPKVPKKVKILKNKKYFYIPKCL